MASFRFPYEIAATLSPWREQLGDSFDTVVAILSDRDRALEDHIDEGNHSHDGAGTEAVVLYPSTAPDGTVASDDYGVAAGYNASATGTQSTAVGAFSDAIDHSTAVGYGAQATGETSTAVGNDVQASGLNAAAVGVFSEASGDYSAAFGYGSTASHERSTAIGGGVSTGTFQIVLGTVDDTVVIPGTLSGGGAGVGVVDSRWSGYTDPLTIAVTQGGTQVDVTDWTVDGSAESDIALNVDGKTFEVTSGTYLISTALDFTGGVSTTHVYANVNILTGTHICNVFGAPSPAVEMGGWTPQARTSMMVRFTTSGTFKVRGACWGGSGNDEINYGSIDIIKIA